LASIYLTCLACSGGERKTPSFLVALPFLVIAVFAAISLGFAPISHWDGMIVGDEWLECLVSVPIIAIVPFAVSIRAVRRANAARVAPHRGLSNIAVKLRNADVEVLRDADWSRRFMIAAHSATASLLPEISSVAHSG